MVFACAMTATYPKDRTVGGTIAVSEVAALAASSVAAAEAAGAK